MNARDIMTAHVITVTPDTTVRELAELLAARGISAVPVVGPKGELVGIVSEGDLVRRSELHTARTRSWWLDMFASEQSLAQDFIKTHAVMVADIMTRDVITVSPDASLSEVARLLEKHTIKRVPVVSNRQLVGIISRANLVQALASLEAKPHSVESLGRRNQESYRAAARKRALGAHVAAERTGERRHCRSLGHRPDLGREECRAGRRRGDRGRAGGQ